MSFHAEDDHVGRRGFVKIGDHARVDVKIALGAEHAQAVFLHRRQMRAAGKQGHIETALREPRADVAADGSGASDQETHTVNFGRAPLADARGSAWC